MKPSVPLRGVKVQAQIDWKDGEVKRGQLCPKKKQEIDRGQKKYSFETRTHFNAPPAQPYSIQSFFSPLSLFASLSAFISFLLPLPPLPGLLAIGSSHYIWAHLFSAPPARHSGRNLVSRNGKGRDRQVWWIPFVLTGDDGSQWAGAAFKRPAKGAAAGTEEWRKMEAGNWEKWLPALLDS